MTDSFSSVQAIANRVHQIRQTIPDTVRLIAVTKQVSVDAMRAAYDAGIRDFGENRVQEAIAKQDQLRNLPNITWHLIGHLQSNKALKALQHFTWIHSLDSLKLALKLNQLAADLPCKPTVCLQVKLLPDPNKYGWMIDDLWDDLPKLDQCDHLNIVGLMVIPPYGLGTDDTLAVFTQAQELVKTISQREWNTIQMSQLSMGMSDDYLLAIQAGATLVRLGRILFGERQ
ncbi:MAG: YggS family pyridoxal phosphate-dependent enzyme [Elainellaceae cyanobacterium]